MPVTFHLVIAAGESGNGHSYEAPHYVIRRDGRDVGTLRPRTVYGWRAVIGECRVDGGKLAEVKRAVRALLVERV